MFGRTTLGGWLTRSLIVAALVGATSKDAWAHCDTMSGPVIAAARKALETGNANLVLIWVEPGDEATIRDEFARARAARGAAGEVQKAAEQRFFEALVRVHRAGEGAPYTGIKPAGVDAGPAVTAADQALAAGKVDAVRAVLVSAVESGIDEHYRAVAGVRNFDPNDVAAARSYVKAYVEYTHFAEGLYDKATAAAAHEHSAADGQGAAQEGHDAAESGGSHAGHSSHAAHLPWILVSVLGFAVAGETGWLVRQRKRNGS